MSEPYNHKAIEKKWQEYWKEHETFKTDVWDFSKPKYYALDMFPYPSGDRPSRWTSGGYTATDIMRVRECRATMYFIRWDMIHSVYRQNSML